VSSEQSSIACDLEQLIGRHGRAHFSTGCSR
jgi:hypothetical protein